MSRTRIRELQSKDSDFLSEDEGAERFIFRDGYGDNIANIALDGYFTYGVATASVNPSGTDLILQNNAGALEILDSTGTVTPVLGGGGGWTTVTKTTNYTTTSNEEVMADTATTGAFTITLPASPTVGDRIRIMDSEINFATNNLTISRNSSLIEGAATDLTLIVDKDDREFVYTGPTRGWAWTSSRNVIG